MFLGVFLTISGVFAQEEDPPIDVPYNMNMVTPHLKWANPYAKGKLKIFMVFGLMENRNVIEVAQRLNCDFETVTLVVGEEPIKWSLGGEGIYDKRSEDEILRGVTQKIKKGGYDVIILGGGQYKDYFKEVEKEVNNQVKKGTGLIQFNMQRVTSKASEFMPFGRMFGRIAEQKWELMDPTNYIVSGFPVAQMKSDLTGYNGINDKVNAKMVIKAGFDPSDKAPYPLLVTGQYGEGRVVGIAGQDDSEAGWGMFMKAIVWAAKKETDLEIVKVATDSKSYDFKDLSKGKLTVSFKPGKDANLTADFYIGTKFIATQKAGGNSVSFDLPPLMIGRYDANVVIKNAEGKSLNWGSAIFTVKADVEFEKISLDPVPNKYFQEPLVGFGQNITGKSGVRAGKGYTVYTELWDNFGRCLARKEGDGKFSFSTKDFLRQRGFVKARVYDAAGNAVCEESEKFIVALSPEARKWDDYEVMLLGGNNNAARTKVFYDVADPWLHGGASPIGDVIDANLRPYPIGIIPNGVQAVSIGAWDQIVNNYQKNKSKSKLIRRPCINSPEYLELEKELAGKVGKAYGALGTIAYMNGDEQSYTSYTKPFDYCFSKDCMAEFRKWLKSEYGTVQKLNMEWESNFADFDTIEPPTLDEVKKDMSKVAGWADHRTFNNITFRKGFDLTVAKLKESDKDLLFGISGTQPPAAYGGHDWDKLMGVFTANMTYWGLVGRIEMSFNPKCKDAPWTGYGVRVSDMKYNLWDQLFHGATGFSYYDASSAVWPDLNPSPAFGEAGKIMEIFKGRGVAKSVMNADRPHDGVAIYYSQPSVTASFMYGGKYNEDWQELDDLLHSAGWEANFVSFSMIKGGGLLKSGYKALFLPGIIALSKEEAEEMKDFVNNGGVIFADGGVGKYDAHAKPYKTKDGILDEIFNKTASSDFGEKKVGKGYTFYQSESFIRMNKKAYYVHKDWISYFKDFKTAVETKAGLKPAYTLSDAAGKTLYRTRLAHFAAGEIKYVGIVAEENKNVEKTRKFKIQLDKAYNVYNCKTGKFLGNTASISDEISQAEGILYALLPYQVSAVSVTGVPATGAKRGMVLPLSISIAAKGEKLGDHVVHVNVYSPEGTLQKHLSKNITSKAGAAVYNLCLPFNSKAGSWKVEALDSASGVSGTLEIKAE